MSDSEDEREQSKVVVCDNGTGFVKCGFGGENFPRHVFQSMLGKPILRAEDAEVDSKVKLKELMIGDEAAAARQYLEIRYPVENGKIKNWTDMELLWKHTFHDVMNICDGVDYDCGEYKVLLTEAPLNWHQVSVFALSRRPGGEDEALRQKGPMLAAVGALMVWMQCATVIGVLQGTLYPSCKSNDQCLTKGTYCAIGGRYPQDPNCWYCGTTAPLGAQVDDETDRGVLNDIESPHYAGMNSTYVQLLCHDPANFVWGEKRPPPEWDEHNHVGFGSQQQQEENPLWQSNVKSWCDACFHLESGTVSEATGWSIPADNITTMGLADYVTYLFAAAFVALTLVGELKVHAC